MDKRIKTILGAGITDELVTVRGWIRTRRDTGSFSFLEVNDGSSLLSLHSPPLLFSRFSPQANCPPYSSPLCVSSFYLLGWSLTFIFLVLACAIPLLLPTYILILSSL